MPYNSCWRLSYIILCVYICYLTTTLAILDVLMTGQEIQRVLFDLSTDVYIVKDGRPSSLLRNPHLSSYNAVIDPEIKYLELKFESSRRVHYTLSISSSDESVMPKPTANIPWSGKVPKSLTAFRIFFPCSGKKDGEVSMGIKIDFFDRITRARIAPINLQLRRKCKRANFPSYLQHILPRSGTSCRKSCKMKDMVTNFCLSDFVVRGKIEKIEENNGTPRYLVKVTRRFKEGHLKLERKNQAIEIRGSRLSCNCQQLELKQVYLIYGREDRRNNAIFLDDFTLAVKWGKSVKKFLRTYKQKLDCPPRMALFMPY